MRYRNRVVTYTLIIYGLIVLFISVIGTASYGFSDFFFGMATVAVFAFILLLVIALVVRLLRLKVTERVAVSDDTIDGALGPPVRDREVSPAEQAKAFLLAAGLILLIGVSSCFGGFSGL